MKSPVSVLTVRFSIFVVIFFVVPANATSDIQIEVNITNLNGFDLNWTNSSCVSSPTYQVTLVNATPNHLIPNWDYCSNEKPRILINGTTRNSFSYDNYFADYNYTINVKAYCNGSLTSEGSKQFSTPVTAPEEANITTPINPVLDSQRNTISANVSWSMPCKPNGILNQYTVSLLHKNKTNQLISENYTVDSSTNYKILTELTPNSQYSITVKAVGNEETKNFTFVPFKTGYLVPPIPTVNILNITSHSFTITWSVNESYPEQIEMYEVFIESLGPQYNCDASCNVDSQYTSTSKNNVTTYVYSEALAAFKYNVIVSAINSAGKSDSKAIQVDTDSGAPPPPNHFELSHSKKSEDYNMVWDMPCRLNGSVSYFDIAIYGESTENGSVVDEKHWNKSFINGVYEYSENVSLRQSFRYSINVSIVLENGRSGEPIETNITTDNGLPGIPELNITNIRSTSFDIAWTNPGPETVQILSYNLSIIPLGPNYDYNNSTCIKNESQVDLFFDNTTYFYKFDLARPFSNYEIRLIASTEAGYGNWSVENTTTDVHTPDAVANFMITNSSQYSYRIDWYLPCNVNGRISYFDVSLEWYYTEEINVTNSTSYPVTFDSNIYHYSFVLTDVLESYFYQVKICVVLDNGIRGTISQGNFTTDPGIPGPPTSVSINSNVLTKAPWITWSPPVEKKGPIVSYDIQIEAIEPLYPTNPNCRMPIFAITRTSNDTNITFYLDSHHYYYYYSYRVSVRANTTAGGGNFSRIFCTSMEGVPEQVNITEKPRFQNELSENYQSTITINFIEPCFLNGILDNYTLTYTNNLTTNVASVVTNSSTFSFLLESPDTNYTFSIQTFNSRYSSEMTNGSFISPAGVPMMTITQETVSIKEADNTVTVGLNKNDFDGSNGVVKYVALILANSNVNEGEIKEYDADTWPIITNDTLGIYQLTEDRWEPFKNTNIKQFVIGDGPEECSESSSQCNKPLQPKTKYKLVVRAYTNTFYRNSPVINFETSNVREVSIIVGTIFGILVPACLGFIIFIVWRRRMIRLPGVLYIKSSSSTKHTPIINTSVPVKKFIQYCRFLENNPEKMKEQFLLLTEKSKEINLSKTKNFAHLPENKRKNRYVNILPYDETRVKLLIDEDDDHGTDYINASYIKGYTGEVEYIATQGPLETTRKDFWKMILQENVSIIVMVSQFIEQDKIKCCRYIPENRQSMYIEDIEIRCSKEFHFGIYCVRTLQIIKDKISTNVIHMQFLEWPDFGVPNGTEHVLQFCYKLRQKITTEGGCVVIHCSAGVGRTGTLIATDMLLQAVNAKKNIDVFNTVFELRKQRVNMVQTENQYIYIHSLVKDYIDRPPAPDLIESTSPIYENVSVLQEQNEQKSNSSKKKLKNREQESRF